MRRFLVGLVVVLAALLPLVASAADATVTVAKNDALGNFLADPKGMTLYMYTRDTPDTSNCYDQCAQAWPPLLIQSGDPVLPAGYGGKLATTTRKDGSRQVTYEGMPLYYYAKDTKPGDTVGQNVGNVWFVVKPVAGTVAPQTGHAQAGVTALSITAAGLALVAIVGSVVLRRRSLAWNPLKRD